MATQIQNAVAILDALADSKGATLTTEQKTAIVEEFINQVGGPATNEEKAADFNSMLVRIIRSTGRAHVERAAEESYEASVQAAADAANSNF